MKPGMASTGQDRDAVINRQGARTMHAAILRDARRQWVAGQPMGNGVLQCSGLSIRAGQAAVIFPDGGAFFIEGLPVFIGRACYCYSCYSRYSLGADGFCGGRVLLLQLLLLLQSARFVASVAGVAVASGLRAFLRMKGGSRLMGPPLA
jgi:hypothetical protein